MRHHYAAAAAAAAALLALLSARPAAADVCTPGLDYPDADLPGMPVVLPGLALANATARAVCASMCAAEPACAFAVTLDPGCDADAAGQAVCYLKSAAAKPTPAACRCGGPAARQAFPAPPAGAQAFLLQTSLAAAGLGARGLVSFSVYGAAAVTVQGDAFALALDGAVVNSSALAAPAASQPDAFSVQYVFTSAPYTITALYELREGWRFVRKTLSVASSAPGGAILVSSVAPWDALLLTVAAAPVGAVYATGDLGTYGVFARFADGTGMVAAATNPMLYPSATPAAGGAMLVHVGYHPSLIWNQSTAYDATPRPFEADAGLLGLYTLSPNAVPPAIEADAGSRRFRATPAYLGAGRASHATDTFAGMRFEHELFAPEGGAEGLPRQLPEGLHRHQGRAADPSWLNYAERDAFRALGEAHFQLPHEGTLRVHIPW
jgi:hypothetical protein